MQKNNSQSENLCQNCRIRFSKNDADLCGYCSSSSKRAHQRKVNSALKKMHSENNEKQKMINQIALFVSVSEDVQKTSKSLDKKAFSFVKKAENLPGYSDYLNLINFKFQIPKEEDLVESEEEEEEDLAQSEEEDLAQSEEEDLGQSEEEISDIDPNDVDFEEEFTAPSAKKNISKPSQIKKSIAKESPRPKLIIRRSRSRSPKSEEIISDIVPHIPILPLVPTLIEEEGPNSDVDIDINSIDIESDPMETENSFDKDAKALVLRQNTDLVATHFDIE